MKVLLVHYYPDNIRGGGAESAVADERKALEMIGCEVRTEFTNPIDAYNEFQPDFVHFHTIHIDLGIDLLKWAQDNHIPHAISLHDYWPICSGRMLLDGYNKCSANDDICNARCSYGPARNEIKNILSKTPKIAFNPYSADIFKRHGVNIEYVVPHGIDTDIFYPPENYSIKSDLPIVCVVAWPNSPAKNIKLLNESLKMLEISGKLITGVSREQVADELRQARISVVPSVYNETWCLALTESMACGCVPIATSTCGTNYQLEQAVLARLIVREYSALELAQMIYRYLNNINECNDIGKRAADWAKRECGLDAYGQRLVFTFRDIINRYKIGQVPAWNEGANWRHAFWPQDAII